MKTLNTILLLVSISLYCSAQTCPDNQVRWLSSGLLIMDHNDATGNETTTLYNATSSITVDICTPNSGTDYTCPTNLSDTQAIGEFNIPGGNPARIRPNGSTLWRNSGTPDGSGGVTGTIIFNLTAGNTLTCTYTNAVLNGTVLPIKLVDFKVTQSDKVIKIEWSTASEINSSYVSVERSLDGRNFAEIEKMMSQGNSSAVRDYVVLDPNPLQGTSYYRLRQVDLDGSENISEVRMITNKRDAAPKLEMFPTSITNGDYLTFQSSFQNGDRNYKSH